MTTLTTASLATEILEGTLLSLEQMSRRLTVLALNASRNPGQSYGVRTLPRDLLADIQDCRIIESGEAHKPAKQQAAIQLLQQKTLATNPLERL
jgi:hypothetical protein